MLKIFKKKANRLLGIDISPSSVKLVELSRTADRYTLEAYAIGPLPCGAIAERQIVAPEVVGQVIAQLVQQTGTQAKYAAVALAGSAVITKMIEMEAGLAGDELESLLQIEAEQHIPYPLADVAIDFTVQQAVGQAANKAHVLLVACRKEHIEVREVALAVAGLKAKVVEIEAHALQRAYPLLADQLGPQTAGQVVAVVDISASLMTLSVLQNGQTLYSREQALAGHPLNQHSQRGSALFVQAQGQTTKPSAFLTDSIDKDLSPLEDAVIEHLTRALQFFSAAGQHSTVDIIVLAGAVSTSAGLEQQVQSQLGRPTLVANPFIAMQLSKTVNAAALVRDAPSLLIACGLAMRGLADDRD